jgi:hypothetical protein
VPFLQIAIDGGCARGFRDEKKGGDSLVGNGTGLANQEEYRKLISKINPAESGNR